LLVTVVLKLCKQSTDMVLIGV